MSKYRNIEWSKIRTKLRLVKFLTYWYVFWFFHFLSIKVNITTNHFIGTDVNIGRLFLYILKLFIRTYIMIKLDSLENVFKLTTTKSLVIHS